MTRCQSWASQVAQMLRNPPAMCGRPRVRKTPWRREWQPTQVFSYGGFHGQRSLAGYSPWGRKQSDRTERLTLREVRKSPKLGRWREFGGEP